MVQYLIAMHNDWFVIGLALGFSHDDLDYIKGHYKMGGSKRWMVGMIQYWLVRYMYVGANWEQVVSALEQLDQFKLASTIKMQFMWDQYKLCYI